MTTSWTDPAARVGLLIGLGGSVWCCHAASAAGGAEFLVTNVAQCWSAPREAFLGRCGFRLEGTLTLVDANRDLLVLQDETGAVAVSAAGCARNAEAQAGQRVVLESARCIPTVTGFPQYPFRPSVSEVRPSFEGPTNLGQFYLTRMRGFVYPPVSGEYTFWIASDNSSELWLSNGEDPTKVSKMCFIPRYGWVGSHEWTRYPSQRSESLYLEAGRSYYVDAFQEQTTGADNLAVAWQGPGIDRAVLDQPYLRPWTPGAAEAAGVGGILRECWTNFSAGTLSGVTGPRAFAGNLSVENLKVTGLRGSAWPKPVAIGLHQVLRPEDNFRWVQVEGEVTFAGRDGDGGLLELSDGQVQVQVRVAGCAADFPRLLRHASVRVEGVCEAARDQDGTPVPAWIYVVKPDGIALLEPANTRAGPSSTGPTAQMPPARSDLSMVGFYATRGVVTFNDQVLGNEYMFVQEDNAVILVSLRERNLRKQVEVGRWVELGGSLQPGKNIPVLSPLAINELGWHALPIPNVHDLRAPAPGSRDGRWTEVEGVVHAVDTNGTAVLVGNGVSVPVWIGKSSPEVLSHYVDARLRVRGVLSLSTQPAPVLLAPSANFVEVEQEAPKEPFATPLRSAADLAREGAASEHRVRVVGNITFATRHSLFVQDATGGVHVQLVTEQELQVGQAIEVVGFPSGNRPVRTLTEALVRPAGAFREPMPRKLDAGKGIAFTQAGTLVQLRARLLSQRVRNSQPVLELQENQRVFEAELPAGELPPLTPGSRVQLTGVCDFVSAEPAAGAGQAAESPSVGALKLWLRTPADVVLLGGPPWWTWKQTAALVGTLLTVLAAALLRIHLLRRRLERQLAFSQQILQSQEHERHRIAANLHDSLGQNLLVIKNQARLAMQPLGDETVLRQRLQEISGCASQAIEEVREITYALRPHQLDRLGLTQAIRALVNRAAEHSSILFASRADEIDGVFDKEAEIHVYRIVQEAVSNILKHSMATEATVVVKKLSAAVMLSIRDNGRGFETSAPEARNGHEVGQGLEGIHERVRILAGTFLIDARPGQGATLSIEIPTRTGNEA